MYCSFRINRIHQGIYLIYQLHQEQSWYHLVHQIEKEFQSHKNVAFSCKEIDLAGSENLSFNTIKFTQSNRLDQIPPHSLLIVR
jgi:hypothetical protein